MARKQFYHQDYRGHIGAVCLLVCTVLAEIFLIIGIPLGVLMSKTVKRQCHTLWGIRPDCWSPAYSWRTEEELCDARRYRWEVAQAFSIIAIFTLVAVGIFAWYCITGSKLKWPAAVASLLSIGAVTVPWSIVTAIYYTNFCGDTSLTHVYFTYGAGFALMVTSFALQCLGLLLHIFLEPESKPAPELETKKGTAPH